jgi:hypothetical protein
MAMETDDNVELSANRRKLICRSGDGRVNWWRGAPSYEEWQRLKPGKIDCKIELGTFLYVATDSYNTVTAVFTPYGGLDFNLVYSVDNGELLEIREAR